MNIHPSPQIEAAARAFIRATGDGTCPTELDYAATESIIAAYHAAPVAKEFHIGDVVVDFESGTITGAAKDGEADQDKIGDVPLSRQVKAGGRT